MNEDDEETRKVKYVMATSKTKTAREETNMKRAGEEQDGLMTEGQRERAIHNEAQRNKPPKSENRWQEAKTQNDDVRQNDETQK